MKILFVTLCLPSPPRFGAQRRVHGLMEALAREHEVSVVSLVDPADDDGGASLRATRAYCARVVTVPNERHMVPGTARRLTQLRSLFSRRSYEGIACHDPAFQRAIDETLAADRFDVVSVEGALLAIYRFAREGRRPVLCLDEHNIEYDLLRRIATAEGSAWRRAYSAVNWRKLRREELRAWRTFDGCAVTSERDEELLRSGVPGARTAVVPNGVDVESFAPMTGEARDPKTILFFGAISYYPNTEALLFFFRKILPIVRVRHPGVKVKVVGPKPPESILAWKSDDVEITGLVDDVRPHIARACCVIAPLRIGGGTRLKILEAMAMGRAVVSTSIGAEGLAVTPEKDILLGDTPEDFAAQIGRVFGDPALVGRLGAAARDLVVARYSWQASVRRLTEFYDRLLVARANAASEPARPERLHPV